MASPRSTETRADAAGGDPLDRRLDRRQFLERMAVLTASASAGGLALTPAAASAATGTTEPRAAGAAARSLHPPPAGRRAPALAPRFPTVPAVADPGALQSVEPWALTLAEAAALIREGRLSPVELVEACLERIDRLDGGLLAFNAVLREAALERARALAPGPAATPLHGVPLAIKDNYYTAGVPTTANSLIYADFVPSFDATTWARLRAGGAILLGKTQMGPLATSRATTPEGANTTVNAWVPADPSVSPGGSSSGSATAVAARMAPSSTGTQTGGSITTPSEAQGLTGLKPTMGRASLYGIIPLTYTRDHPGPLARDAMDAAVMLQAMAGPDPADPRTLGLPPVPDLVEAATPVREGRRTRLRWPTTIGVLPGWTDPPSETGDAGADEQRQEDPERTPEQDAERRRRAAAGRAREAAAAAARRRMLDTFRDLGARVVEVEPPEDWDTLTSRDFNNVRLPERSEPFLDALREDVRLFGVSLSPWINGLLLPGAEYLRGQRAKLLLLRRILDDVFGRCDVWVQTRPFPFDMVGLPLITFPIGYEEASAGVPRPLGALLGGQPYAEDRLVSLAAAFQAVTDFHRRRPADPEPGALPPAPREARSRGRPGSLPRRGARGDHPRGRTDVDEVMATGQ